MVAAKDGVFGELERAGVDLLRDEVVDVVVAADDGAVVEDVADGLFDLKAKVESCVASGAPGMLKAQLLELRGCVAVNGLGEEKRASVAGHGGVQKLARSRGNLVVDGRSWRCEGLDGRRGGCADTEEGEVSGEVEDTRVSVERAGEVEEEMMEGTKARRTTAIAVGVGGAGGTKNSTKCNGRALPSGDYCRRGLRRRVWGRIVFEQR
ncbi:hypothetical protein BKA62DRAFT_676487 [Auriculariales sp. MPI-PUGE-AT-0066]|nr:hypothetical protein BKA62DRAFT_676487 [Auriculariales sp. MPI-PUGE-AT-0066]